jgi:hypothetical protein
MIAAVLTLEERRQNVIGVCQAAFPILTQNSSERLDQNVTSFVYRSDLVPRLSSVTISGIVRMFTGMAGSQEQAAAMIQGIVGQMVQGVMSLDPYGLYNPQMTAAMQAQLPTLVQRLIRSTQVVERYEFVLPGRGYLLGNDADGNPQIRRYTAADGGFNVTALLMGVGDHNPERYRDVLFLLDALE